MNPPVLLTDGTQRAALAIARSLHARGVEVVALAAGDGGYAARSRAFRDVIPAPRAGADARGFLDAAQQAVRHHGIGLVIPVAGADLVVLDAARDAFAGTRLAMTGRESLRLALDKRANLELAALLGLPVPRTLEPSERAQLPGMIAALGWPMVMKRPGPRLDPRVPQFGFRVALLQDRGELERALAAYCPAPPLPLFQEFVPGEAFNLSCFAIRGEIVAIHQYQLLRSFRGRGVLQRIVPADVLLEAHARRLLRALGWDGVAQVAFRSDPRTGRSGYLQVEGHFGDSTQLSIDAGWDLPWWIYRRYVHGERPQPPRLNAGTTTRWHCGDLRALNESSPAPDPAAAAATPASLDLDPPVSLRDVLGGWFDGTRSETFRWHDPGPGLLDLRQGLHELWRHVAARAGLPVTPRTGSPPAPLATAISRSMLQSVARARRGATGWPQTGPM